MDKETEIPINEQDPGVYLQAKHFFRIKSQSTPPPPVNPPGVEVPSRRTWRLAEPLSCQAVALCRAGGARGGEGGVELEVGVGGGGRQTACIQGRRHRRNMGEEVVGV